MTKSENLHVTAEIIRTFLGFDYQITRKPWGTGKECIVDTMTGDIIMRISDCRIRSTVHFKEDGSSYFPEAYKAFYDMYPEIYSLETKEEFEIFFAFLQTIYPEKILTLR